MREQARPESLSKEDELELLRRWRGGDKGAGNRLLAWYLARLYQFFSCTVKERYRDDLVQETIDGFLKRVDHYESWSSPRAYLVGIARMKLMDHLRRLYEEGREVEFDSSKCSVYQTDRVSPSELIANKERKSILVECIQSLSVERQLVIQLHYWAGMSPTEIAAAYEVAYDEKDGTSKKPFAPETVRTRLFRARAELREMLQEKLSDRARDEQALEEEIRGLGRLLFVGFDPAGIP